MHAHPLAGVLPLVCGLSCLALGARAQGSIISPTTVSATIEGSTANAFPWFDTRVRRYMQIHSDLGATPRLFTKVNWRRQGGSAAIAGSRSFDMELYMGASLPFDSPSWVLSNNYVGPRTLVFTRKLLTIGPLPASTSPSPFEISAVLDTPILYVGAGSMAWEAVIYAVTTTGTYAGGVDIDAATMTPGVTSGGTITGTGCIATGQSAEMNHGVTTGDAGGTLILGSFLQRGPASAPTVWGIGVTNPNLTIPGLCASLLTELAIVLPIGNTDAAGLIGAESGIAGGAAAFGIPNTASGATIFSQLHAIDAGQPGLPVANSNGRSFVVPLANPTKVVKATRLFNNVGGVTAANAIVFNNSTVGHAIPTEFVY